MVHAFCPLDIPFLRPPWKFCRQVRHLPASPNAVHQIGAIIIVHFPRKNVWIHAEMKLGKKVLRRGARLNDGGTPLDYSLPKNSSFYNIEIRSLPYFFAAAAAPASPLYKKCKNSRNLWDDWPILRIPSLAQQVWRWIFQWTIAGLGIGSSSSSIHGQ